MENRVKKEGNNYTPDKVFDELTVWPKLNILTIMTVVRIPKTGYHNATVWEEDTSIGMNNIQAIWLLNIILYRDV